MTRLRIKAKRILRNKKGESLMEGVVSLLVFTILITTVATMINASLVITGNNTTAATARQINANVAALERGAVVAQPLRITGGGIDVVFDVTLSQEDDLISFSPEV